LFGANLGGQFLVVERLLVHGHAHFFEGKVVIALNVVDFHVFLGNLVVLNFLLHLNIGLGVLALHELRTVLVLQTPLIRPPEVHNDADELEEHSVTAEVGEEPPGLPVVR